MEKSVVNMPHAALPNKIKCKIEVIESTLDQAIYYFRDFVTELKHIYMEAESARKKIIAQQEKCEGNNCLGSEQLKKEIQSKDYIIQSKDNIIHSVASELTKLDETKNFTVLSEIFKILYGDMKPSVSSFHDVAVKEVGADLNIKKSSISPNKAENELNDLAMKDESVSEIEGTPTGRRSPIIQTKKIKSSTPNNNIREKKKCPDNWLTPEKKSFKVTLTPTKSKSLKGGGRLRQQRLTMIKQKPDNIVDLTTSPQFNVGRASQEECLTNIKQEAIENEDTILPSPTSGPAFPSFYKVSSTASPQKFKKPLSLIRKAEKSPEMDNNNTNIIKIKNIEKKDIDEDATCISQLDSSINILEGFTEPKKYKTEKKSPISTKENILLLQQGDKTELTDSKTQVLSPSKRPLAENINYGNTACDSDSSMSILRRDVKVVKMEILNKKLKSEAPEPLYKEPTVRKKAEKQALQGWACDECIRFYTAHYKDNPELAEKKIKECSKHRGRHNPVPPKSPVGFWSVRWDVPEDTDEFNRRNNAV